MVEVEIGSGEFFTLGSDEPPRPFKIFEVAPNIVEARFSDGSAPVVAEVSRLATEEVAEALSLETGLSILLDCDTHLIPSR